MEFFEEIWEYITKWLREHEEEINDFLVEICAEITHITFEKGIKAIEFLSNKKKEQIRN